MLSASLVQLEYASKDWKSTFSYFRECVQHNAAVHDLVGVRVPVTIHRTHHHEVSAAVHPNAAAHDLVGVPCRVYICRIADTIRCTYHHGVSPAAHLHASVHDVLIILTRSRGGPGHGTLRLTRTSKQAGKALRSQGHHYARVM